ncbi:MAG: type I polyketide synthase, partial [Verrucomicrobiota bacterium]
MKHSPMESAEAVEQRLVHIAAETLELEPDRIDVNASFADYGVGSLQGVLLVDAINRAFGLRLNIQVIYDYSNLRELARFIDAEFPQRGASPERLSTSAKRARLKQMLKEGRSLPEPEKDGQLEAQLIEIAATTLEMEPERIDVNARFSDYGVGSLQGVLLLDAINRAFDLSLKIQVLYDHSSLRDLGAILDDQVTVTETPAPVRSSKTSDADIAVIGMAGRFPGAEDVDTFWEQLKSGADAVTEIPPSRWDIAGFYDPDPKTPDRSYSKWGGFLDGVDCFDPLFFNLSPAEAEMMDPQQRIYLETCWHALEDAGYAGLRLKSATCGIYAGVIHNDYKALLAQQEATRHGGQMMLGNANSILAARMAYFLNLKGPVITVDTACSSSLVAVHMACRSLRDGDADLMLAGG